MELRFIDDIFRASGQRTGNAQEIAGGDHFVKHGKELCFYDFLLLRFSSSVVVQNIASEAEMRSFGDCESDVSHSDDSDC